MPDPKDKTIKRYELRARMPQYFRIAAVAAIGIAILVVATGFYRARTNTPFRLKGEHAQLSTDVVLEVNNYERLESDAGVPKYYIKADHAKTFSDDHQELQNVYLEVFSEDGAAKDVMSAESAIYIPEPEKNFTTYFKGNVNIATRHALNIKTNHVIYSKKTEIAEADETVEFDRENVRGRSFGAIVHVAAKKIELLKDVEIETFESPELARSNIRYAKINAGSAVFDQLANAIDLNTNVAINLTSATASGGAQNTDINADRASVRFVGEEAANAQLRTFELFDNVRISSAAAGSTPTNLASGYVKYDRSGDRFDMKQNAHVSTVSGGKATDLRATEIVYERSAGKAELKGAAEIQQGPDSIKGDTILADIYSSGKIREAVVRGNGNARQVTAERTTTVSSPEMNATFSEAGHVTRANAVGQSLVEILPADTKAYTKIVTNADRGIGVSFKGEGLIDALRTDGRTSIQLNAPTGDPNNANKRVTADSVKAVFHANGKDLRSAEAVGNAELFVEPLTAAARNYRTSVSAPRFDCEFYDSGSNVKTCVAGRKAKATREPTMPSASRGTQVLTADQMTAHFEPQANDVQTLEATGNTKFVESDRNAVASQFTFTRADEVLRLRGGEPTVWDSRARAKAREIDWHTGSSRSYLRGNVSTTYYNGRQMRDATPFGSTDKPVYMTAANAEFDHLSETAVFTGNARGWQENNYVRGDRIAIDQKAGKFVAEGGVQSALYAARIRTSGSGTVIPTHASAGSVSYDRGTRVLQYRTAVDIRQGTDRLTAGAADVFLDESNELSKTVAQDDVVITQPGRRASGSWAQYTAEDQVAILRGQPATVSDAESGSSQNAEIRFFMREKRVIAEGSSKQNTSGRSRSVYKVKIPK